MQTGKTVSDTQAQQIEILSAQTKYTLRQLEERLKSVKTTPELAAWYEQFWFRVALTTLEDRKQGRADRYPLTLRNAIQAERKRIDGEPNRPLEEGEYTRARGFLVHVSQGQIQPIQYGPTENQDIEVIADKLKKGASDYAETLQRSAQEGWDAGVKQGKKSVTALEEAMPEVPSPPGGYGLWVGGSMALAIGALGLVIVRR